MGWTPSTAASHDTGSDSDGDEQESDQYDSSDKLPSSSPLSCLCEEKLWLANLCLNVGGVDNRHGGPSNPNLMELL